MRTFLATLAYFLVFASVVAAVIANHAVFRHSKPAASVAASPTPAGAAHPDEEMRHIVSFAVRH
jgi:hypothetical protein